MGLLGRYICAFRGRRDYYQVPLALAEADMLDEFITDAYSGPVVRSVARFLPRRLREKADFRYEAGLPDRRIKCLWGTTAIEHVRRRLGYRPSATFAKLDQRFSLVAAAQARKSRGNLFLYSPYAWEAFTAKYPHSPKKVLFQFHPHADTEKRILQEDCGKYPFVRQSFEEDTGEHIGDSLKQRNQDSWKYADLILCASSFTKRSLIEVGADPGLCKIVPYGIDVTEENAELSASDQFRVLFVGAGTQRKGLHHLLLAWQRASLPKGSHLTLVCRFIDPAIAAMVGQTANVSLIPGVQNDKLKTLFRTSSLFAMPSLVEGFGQVYLEALAEGCPVLGTPNSCLPDLSSSEGPIWQVKPGQIDQLVTELESLSRKLPADVSIRESAKRLAKRWPWLLFREGIRSTVEHT